MRLTLVISSLQCGGAERVMSTMANHWAAKDWQVTLLTLDDGSAPPFYNLERRVSHIPLGLSWRSNNAISGLRNNLRRVSSLRQAIRDSNPEAVISFLSTTNVTTLLATRGMKVPVIVSERIDPGMYPIGKAWELMRRHTYPLADLLVVQSEAALGYFSGELHSHAVIIPNPVVSPTVNHHSPENQLIKPTVISIGRLDRQKGFDILLRAFAQSKGHHDGWGLTIFGEGPMRIELERLRDVLGLRDKVFLPGRVREPQAFLMQADLFILSSRFEGFPNALCEAMACGLPVIAFDCPSGPREIIRDGVDGVLVPSGDVYTLTSTMNRLMSDESERRRLASRAKEVLQRFALESVMRMWEEALGRVGVY